jgi:hypothetical protein
MPRGFALLFALACVLASGHAQDSACIIRSGEVVGIRDPRLHDPTCVIEVGVTLRLYVEEVQTRVLRARIERRPACLPAPDEAALVATLTEKAVAYLHEKGADDAGIELVDMPCAEKRGVDLVIVEVK